MRLLVVLSVVHVTLVCLVFGRAVRQQEEPDLSNVDLTECEEAELDNVLEMVENWFNENLPPMAQNVFGDNEGNGGLGPLVSNIFGDQGDGDEETADEAAEKRQAQVGPQVGPQDGASHPGPPHMGPNDAASPDGNAHAGMNVEVNVGVNVQVIMQGQNSALDSLDFNECQEGAFRKVMRAMVESMMGPTNEANLKRLMKKIRN